MCIRDSINGDTHSGKTNFKELEIDSAINDYYQGRCQPVYPGSCVIIDSDADITNQNEFTLGMRIMPTTPGLGEQHIIGCWDDENQTGWSLYLTSSGGLGFHWSSHCGQNNQVITDGALSKSSWYQISLRVSWPCKQVILKCTELSKTDFSSVVGKTQLLECCLEGEYTEPKAPFMIAASFGGYDSAGRFIPKRCFNGRVEAPYLYAGILTDSELSVTAVGERPGSLIGRIMADWDFSIGINSARITDGSPNNYHGTTHNLPLRAVKSSDWDGSFCNWSDAPQHYAAIHFHSDDLYDCGWLTAIEYKVPKGLASGVYALRLRQRDNEEYIPFFVASPKGRPNSRLAFIMPTYTYLAYGNIQHHEAARRRLGMAKKKFYDAQINGPGTEHYAMVADRYADLGGSTYDLHRDVSPVHYSSWLRPLLNMRPKTMLWTFCADLLTIDWLEVKNINYDIITDDLLQAEGVSLLANYSVVMSGNHPEYPTTEQLDAIQAFLGRGGRFMYMGGNGYYWRSAVNQSLPGVIEVRRGQTGTGTWKSEIGENYLSFTGELGGIWRDIGRPPQQTFGVGFIAEGGGASYFRISEAARRNNRTAFIFNGVKGDIIGDEGIFNGAAGQEIDQSNSVYGTPEHAITLARSEKHSSDMLYVIEEMRTNVPIPSRYADNVYAEMVFFETANGGAVFSVGSMAWCGSLSHNQYDNNVSTITSNVIARFCNPAALVIDENNGDKDEV